MYCDFVLISGYLLIICAEFCVFIVNLIYLWTLMKYFMRFHSNWLICFVKFVLFLHIWYFAFFYVIFAPTVCVCEIVIVDILLCGLTCGYAYTSGTCDINLRTPFGDEYVCGLQTHLRIVPLLDSLSLVFRDELWYLFQLLLLFREYISDVFCFYSPGVVYVHCRLHT